MVRPAGAADRRGARLRGRGRGRLRAGGRLAALGRASRRGCAGSTARSRRARARCCPSSPRVRAGPAAARSEQRRACSTRSPRRCSPPGTPLLLVADDLQWFDAPDAAVPALPRALARPTRRCWWRPRPRREELDAGHPLERAGRRAAGARPLLGDRARPARPRGDEPCWPERLARAAGRRAGRPPVRRDRGQPAAPGRGGPGAGAAQRRPRAGGDRGAPRAGSPAPASELAGVAATIGREFTAPVLADASDASRRAAFVRGLDELWRRGIVRAHEHDALRLQPRPDPRGRLRRSAPRSAATTTCASRGRSSARPRTDPGGAAPRSTTAAGAIDDAVRWYVRAADAAQRALRPRRRRAALERALALCARLPATASATPASWRC